MAFDPNYWRGRAAESYAIACSMEDPVCRRAMERVGQGYEQLADHAERLRDANLAKIDGSKVVPLVRRL